MCLAGAMALFGRTQQCCSSLRANDVCCLLAVSAPDIDHARSCRQPTSAHQWVPHHKPLTTHRELGHEALVEGVRNLLKLEPQLGRVEVRRVELHAHGVGPRASKRHRRAARAQVLNHGHAWAGKEGRRGAVGEYCVQMGGGWMGVEGPGWVADVEMPGGSRGCCCYVTLCNCMLISRALPMHEQREKSSASSASSGSLRRTKLNPHCLPSSSTSRCTTTVQL